MKMRNIKLFGRTVPIVALILSAVLILGSSAALVNYLSTTVTQPVSVASPIELSGKIRYLDVSTTLGQSANGIADWSTDYAESGSYSVILSVEDIAATPLQYAEVSIDVEDFPLGASPPVASFSCYSTEGTVIPRFIFELPGTYPNGGTLLVIYAYDSIPSTGYTADFATFEPTAEGAYSWEIYTGDWDGWIAGGYAPTWSELLTAINDYTKKTAGELTVANVLVLLSRSVLEEVGPHTAYVDDITINTEVYDFEQVTNFDGIATLVLRGGDSFSMDFKAKNWANTAIDAPLALVIENPSAWNDGEISGDPAPLWYGVSEDGKYLVLVFDGLDTIDPGATNELPISVQLSPAAETGTYEFRAVVVWDGIIGGSEPDLSADSVIDILTAAGIGLP